jgi:hypothetical protein
MKKINFIKIVIIFASIFFVLSLVLFSKLKTRPVVEKSEKLIIHDVIVSSVFLDRPVNQTLSIEVKFIGEIENMEGNYSKPLADIYLTSNLNIKPFQEEFLFDMRGKLIYAENGLIIKNVSFRTAKECCNQTIFTAYVYLKSPYQKGGWINVKIVDFYGNKLFERKTDVIPGIGEYL